jgi:hypothetical protein
MRTPAGMRRAGINGHWVSVTISAPRDDAGSAVAAEGQCPPAVRETSDRRPAASPRPGSKPTSGRLGRLASIAMAHGWISLSRRGSSKNSLRKDLSSLSCAQGIVARNRTQRKKNVDRAMPDNPKVNPEPQSNTVKNPEDWVSGDEPMTGAQASYLKTLSEQAHDPHAFEPTLTKAGSVQAHRRAEGGTAGA